MANEDDELEEFLGIPRKTPKFDPNAGTNTGGDVGKLEQPTVNGTADKRYWGAHHSVVNVLISGQMWKKPSEISL